ncbi:MAG: sigma-E factor negative regulatory protein [Methylovulum sp.]|nr:sigma-E factor negative regulatory protein [Methylovulum sp.]
MNKELNQYLSQLLDDELDHQVALDLLQKIQTNPDLKNTLTRYTAINHALKTDDFLPLPADFSEKIARQIDQEVTYFLPQKKPARPHYKRVALAASVAVVAVLAARGINNPQIFPMQSPAPQQLAKQTPVQPNEQLTVGTTPQDPASLNARISDYLDAHNNGVYTGEVDVDFRPLTKVTSYNQK